MCPGGRDTAIDDSAQLLAEGRAALREGDAARARHAFERLDPASGEALEGLARAGYLELDVTGSIRHWERAYAVYRSGDDQLGAVRVARSLACAYGTMVGDFAVMQGWLARAQTLLAEAGESPERGWVWLNIGMFAADRALKDQHFRDALRVARVYGDLALEVSALSYLGASLVHGNRTEEGMVLLDEALAAVAGSEVDDFIVLEEVFCQLFSACEHAHDVTRADQWIRIGDAIAARRKLPAVSAYCRTHYGGVLTAAGRWPEADEALTAAVDLWELGHRSSLRVGAVVRLADLRVRQGRLEEAEQLLASIDAQLDTEAARPLATIHLARGEFDRACDVLERALDSIDPVSGAAAPLLALLVDVHLASDRPADAVAAADRLDACAAHHPSPYLVGEAALGRGRVALVSGSGDAQACLREALAGFSRAQLPMEIARSRLELASALLTSRPDVALAEARGALDAFERLRAARYVDATTALLRTLGVRTSTTLRGDGRLTTREASVLDLLGHGLSNRQIADRLFISHKTVEHHVSNILAKLGLRGRAEAAAYATRH